MNFRIKGIILGFLFGFAAAYAVFKLSPFVLEEFENAKSEIDERGGSEVFQSGSMLQRFEGVLWIGWDAADWNLLDPLMEQGRMPHFNALKNQGSWGLLKTIPPALSPVVWTSMATGVSPEHHGILDFWVASRVSGNRIPITSNIRQAPALWNILSESDLSSIFVGFWGTWPAERVKGAMVSDRVAYQLFRYDTIEEEESRKVFPELLYDELGNFKSSRAGIRHKDTTRFWDLKEEDFYAGAMRDPGLFRTVDDFKGILSSTITYYEMARYLLAKYSPQFFCLYFEGTDTICHLFARYRPPAMEGVSEEEVRRYGETIENYYIYHDELLGELLSINDGKRKVMLCSDHGFKFGDDRPITDPRIGIGPAADWHRKFGIVLVDGDGVKKNRDIGVVGAMDIAPTLLAMMNLPIPANMEGEVLRDAFKQQYLAQLPKKAAEPVDVEGIGETEPVASSLDGQIMDKLANLGYVDSETPASQINLGTALMGKGEIQKAKDQFESALEDNPNSVPALANLASIYIREGRVKKAEELISKALEMDPESEYLRLLEADILQMRGQAVKAEEKLKELLELNPRSAQVHSTLAKLYMNLNQLDKAEKEFLEALKADPMMADALNSLGNIAKSQGKLDTAETYYLKAIEADPDFIGPYNNLGLLYGQLNKEKDARRYYEEAIEVQADNPFVHNNYGTFLLQLGDLRNAEKKFRQAIELNPYYAEAHNNLGIVKDRQELIDEAEEAYRNAVKANPDFAEAYHNLALLRLKEEKFDQALSLFEDAMERNPDYASAWIRAASIYQRRGELEKALEYYKKALNINPKLFRILNSTALILHSLDRKQEALEYLEESLAVQPAQTELKKLIRLWKQEIEEEKKT